jgi:hypothetical protein
MCFGGGQKDPPPPPPVPASPPPPTRADETNKAAVNSELDTIRRRKGSESTILTGGLGDSGYGANVQSKTLLGQ